MRHLIMSILVKYKTRGHSENTYICIYILVIIIIIIIVVRKAVIILFIHFAPTNVGNVAYINSEQITSCVGIP